MTPPPAGARALPLQIGPTRTSRTLLLVTGALLVLACVLLRLGPWRLDLHTHWGSLRAWTAGLGVPGVAVFGLAAAGLVAAGFPRLVLSAAAGSLFGAWQGTGIAALATLCGALLSFLVVRGCARERASRLLDGRATEACAGRGLPLVLHVRLFPAGNSLVTSALLACADVTVAEFAGGTALACLPSTALVASLASTATSPLEAATPTAWMASIWIAWWLGWRAYVRRQARLTA